jgi:tetratricopeptide (TPR) repeat protein
MIYQTPRMVHAQRLLTPCLLILFTLVFPDVSRAQMGGIDPDPGSRGTGGRNTIEGRIYYPSGRTVDKRLKVRLSGLTGGDFFTLSDDSGAFSFRRIGGGTYIVSLDGEKEYEPVNERVDIFDSSSSRGTLFGRSYIVQIQLRLKGSGREKSGVINAALMAAPKPAAELYQKALQSEKDGDINKAVDELQRAVALYPQFTLALNELGILYQRLGKLEEAAKALGAAVKIAPETFELRLNYGIVLLKNKQFAEADTQLRHATEIRSASTLAHLYRGKALIQLRQYPQAEKELQEVIKLGGEDVPMAYRFLGALYNERGETQLAIKALEKYLSLAPNAKDADSVREIIKQLRAQS